MYPGVVLLILVWGIGLNLAEDRPVDVADREIVAVVGAVVVHADRRQVQLHGTLVGW